MFLQSIQSKGKHYIYLLSYDNSPQRKQGKKIVYRFGRSNVAMENMTNWKTNLKDFPDELKTLGCNHMDLDQWIQYIITKTGK